MVQKCVYLPAIRGGTLCMYAHAYPNAANERALASLVRRGTAVGMSQASLSPHWALICPQPAARTPLTHHPTSHHTPALGLL